VSATWAVLAFAAAVAAGQEPEAPAAPPAPTVLFVCEHAAGRSPIAAAWFDKLAREKGLPHRAVFRGTSPDASLSPAAREGLERDGLEVPAAPPLPVTTDDIHKAQRIVVMGCPLPAREAVAAKVVDWDGVPGPGEGYDASRDDIRASVQRLVDELTGGSPSP
jgi:arsenate reductase (thioredoxin)